MDIMPSNVNSDDTAVSSNPLMIRKGILRFDIIDETGWQWTELHLNRQSRGLEVLELTEDARAAVNDRRNRFSWTGDGRRHIEDKEIRFRQGVDDGSSVEQVELC